MAVYSSRRKRDSLFLYIFLRQIGEKKSQNFINNIVINFTNVLHANEIRSSKIRSREN